MISSSVIFIISLDRDKIRLLFNVLFVRSSYLKLELLHFYEYGGRPLVSILILCSQMVLSNNN